MPPVKPYVLVVDDCEDGREMLGEYLAFRGLDVIEVSSGGAALAQARIRRPALILMDLRMPGIDGWEATRRLKAHADTKDIIVIALTAQALTGDEGIARQAGCDAFITKPFDILAVGNAITEIIHRGRAGLVAVDALTPSQAKRPRGGPVART